MRYHDDDDYRQASRGGYSPALMKSGLKETYFKTNFSSHAWISEETNHGFFYYNIHGWENS